MKKEAFRILISLAVFVLCLALTFPFVTGLADFTSLKDSFNQQEETSTTPETEYDPYDPSWLFTSAVVTDAPETPEQEVTTKTPETTEVEPVTPDVTTSPKEITTEEATTEAVTTEEPTTADVTTAKPDKDNYPWTTVDKSYFNDALFIGDSRTLRLCWACGGSLGTAHFFAGESWSCAYAMGTSSSAFNSAQSGSPYNQKYTLPMLFCGTNSGYTEVGRMTLETALQTYQYKKIYIMFGLNEIGYTVDGIVTPIARMVSMCLVNCPDATIYVEANMLMTAAYSASSRYGSNEKLLAVNERLSALANWDNILYIDVNDLMGDGNGNASTEYSDGAHQKWNSGTKAWVNWLYTKGRANP